MLFLQNMMVNGDAFFSAMRWRLLSSARALCGTTAGVGPFGYGISCIRHNRLVLGNSAHVCLLTSTSHQAVPSYALQSQAWITNTL